VGKGKRSGARRGQEGRGKNEGVRTEGERRVVGFVVVKGKVYDTWDGGMGLEVGFGKWGGGGARSCETDERGKRKSAAGELER